MGLAAALPHARTSLLKLDSGRGVKKVKKTGLFRAVARHMVALPDEALAKSGDL